MALPTRPLAILDACGTTRSIARCVDGNATPPKSLDTLGDTAFGTGAAPHAMSDFEGYSPVVSKCVSYVTYFNSGGCGSPGPVINCSCLSTTPSMVIGDRYDAGICYTLGFLAAGSGCACMTIRCNGLFLTSCNRTFTGCYTGVYTAQDIDYNDLLTVCIQARAFTSGTQVCASTNLASITDQQGSTFINCGGSNFVIATCF
jgi:hypothetical protein